jgi:MFS family permease
MVTPDVGVDEVQPSRATADAGFLAWYTVTFLTLSATLSTIDRQVLALMIGPIKRDFGVSDTLMGFLAGPAFTILYSLATLPVAWVADRTTRRGVIIVGMYFWSFTSAACGFAARFTSLFLARMGVGLGESALSPAAYSMLSDLFPARRLPLALGLLTAAPFLGVGFAYGAGGIIVQALETTGGVTLPFVGHVRSWQAAFMLVGAPGVVLATLGLFTLPEPKRTGRAEEKPLSLAQVVTFFGSMRAYLGLQFIAYIALSIQGWSLFFWVVEFLVRERGLQRAEAGFTYGMMAFALGLIGSLFSGWLGSAWQARGRADATMRLTTIGVLALTPLAIFMPWPKDGHMVLLMLAPITFLMGWPGGLGTTALQFVVPNELKGRIIALYLLVVNCIALTFGPWLGGLISDQVFHGKSLGSSLSLMASINYPIACVCLILCLKPFRAALERAKAWH